MIKDQVELSLASIVSFWYHQHLKTTRVETVNLGPHVFLTVINQYMRPHFSIFWVVSQHRCPFIFEIMSLNNNFLFPLPEWSLKAGGSAFVLNWSQLPVPMVGSIRKILPHRYHWQLVNQFSLTYVFEALMYIWISHLFLFQVNICTQFCVCRLGYFSVSIVVFAQRNIFLLSIV